MLSSGLRSPPFVKARQPVARGVTSLTALLAFGLLAICTALALTRPIIVADSWSYHLPFSSRLFGIGGGEANFHLTPFLTERWRGFPKAWEWIQGLAWLLAGSLYVVVVPQILLCLGYFYYVGRSQHIPIAWVILGFFASPMLLIHYEAIYLDLPAAVCIALGFFIVIDLLTATPPDPLAWRWRAAGAVATFGLAGNIKYQSLVAAWGVLGVLAALCIGSPGIPVRRRTAVLGVLLASAVLASSSAASNAVRFDNPFYPLKIVVHGITVFDGPEAPDGDASPPTYPIGNRDISLPEPLIFILSATEIDWTLRGVAPLYSLDSASGRTPRRGAPSRTGGWGALFVLVNVFVLALQTIRVRHERDQQQRRLLIGTLALVLMTACLPRAHELRYWLFLPLVILPVNLRYLARWPRGAVPGALLALAACGAAQAFLSPGSELLSANSYSTAYLRAQIPPAITQALHDTGRYCDPADSYLFRSSAAVTGVPGVLSRVAADCP